jgi:hypothetical protein
MMDELRVDQEVARLLDEAQIPMAEQWHARVLVDAATMRSPGVPRRWWALALAPATAFGLWLFMLHTPAPPGRPANRLSAPVREN